jgi:hypothetical protein
MSECYYVLVDEGYNQFTGWKVATLQDARQIVANIGETYRPMAVITKVISEGE